MQFAVRRGGVQYGESKFVYYGVNNEMTEEKEGAMKAVQELLEVSDPEDEQETTRNTTPSRFTFPTNSTPITQIITYISTTTTNPTKTVASTQHTTRGDMTTDTTSERSIPGVLSP